MSARERSGGVFFAVEATGSAKLAVSDPLGGVEVIVMIAVVVNWLAGELGSEGTIVSFMTGDVESR